jgi:hypothetical protein
MQRVFLALVGLLAACSQAPSGGGRQQAQEEQAPGAKTAPAGAPTAAPAVTEGALIGSWSQDHACASDWGFSLSRNGEIIDDDGVGLWAIDAAGRVVTIVRVQEMGMDPDPNAPRKVRVLTVREISSDGLIGTYDDGEAINARRCPAPSSAAAGPGQNASAGSTGVGRID